VQEKHLENILNWVSKSCIWTDILFAEGLVYKLNSRHVSGRVGQKIHVSCRVRTACGWDFQEVPVFIRVQTGDLCVQRALTESGTTHTRVWTTHLPILKLLESVSLAHFSHLSLSLALSLSLSLSLSPLRVCL